MSNKIDGGQSGLDRLTDAAADFFGVGDEELDAASAAKTPEKKAEKKADAGECGGDSDVLDDMGDAVGEFWEGVTGTASKAVGEIADTAGDAVSDIAQSAAKAAGDVGGIVADEVVTTVSRMQQDVHDAAVQATSKLLSEAVEDLHEIAPIPDDIVAEAEEHFIRAETATVELAEAVDALIESHPKELVAEAAARALTGDWDIAADIAMSLGHAGIDVLNASTTVVDQVVVDGYLLGDEVVEHFETEFYSGLVKAGCDFIVENGEILRDAGSFVEAALDNEEMEVVSTIQNFMPGGLVLNGARSIALTLADAAQAAPAVAEDLRKHPEKIQALCGDRDYPEIAADLRKLPVGDSFHEKRGMEVSIYGGVGGAVGGASTVDCKRTGANSYEITMEAEGLLAIGFGEKVQTKGIDVSVFGKAKGKITISVSGKNALEDAARIMACVNGETDDFVRLKDVDFEQVELRELTFREDIGGSASAFKTKLAQGYALESGLKTIDGQPYQGISGSFNPSLSIETETLQINDDLAENWLQDPSTGNPAFDALFSQLPDGLVSDIKNVYGPTAGIKLGAKAEISAAILTPAGESEPIRAEFTVKCDLQAGRSTLKTSASIVIPDLEKLAEAVHMNVDELSQKLSTGEISIQQLREMGAEINALWDFKGPTVVLEQTQMNAVSALGFTYESGTIDPEVLYNPPNTVKFRENLRKALDDVEASSGQNAPGDPAADVRANLLAAHAGRV
jgi:hypothetical protein